MGDTPIQRDSPTNLDRVLAAHERRTRLIAQLHDEAIAAAYNSSVEQRAMRTARAENAQGRKAEAWLPSAEDFVIALCCLVAFGCMLAVWL
jgi:hypothetical protein